MMEFLYFPEDKSEYLPSIITLTIFTIGALVAVYLFYKKSKKEEMQLNDKYKIDRLANEESDKNDLP